MNNIRYFFGLALIFFVLFSCGSSNTTEESAETEPAIETEIGTLETVAEMDINPGNVAVSSEGRIFCSIHPLRSKDLQLVEITSKSTYVPFPNTEVQSTQETKSDSTLDTPLGVIVDKLDRLWIIDAGLNLGKTRLFAYDITTKKELFRFDIPEELAPSTSFVQDLAIDEGNGLAYLADFGNPGIIVVTIEDGSFRKIVDLPTMQSEDIDMIIDGSIVQFNGSPARIGLNPITLSENRETIYYGAMNGTKWYQLPTLAILNNEPDSAIISKISVAGKKPMSDGVATDDNGNHYFTNIQNSSIDKLAATGELTTLKKDALLDWPDNVRVNGDWLYIAVNQLHKSPAFTGNQELSEPPYRIMRLKYR